MTPPNTRLAPYHPARALACPGCGRPTTEVLVVARIRLLGETETVYGCRACARRLVEPAPPPAA